ncbi:MAG: hypothetical protein ACYC2G_16005 [Gemmatimonadaceae bacterium]
MAQLDIERKPGSSMWWLWLLIALIVVLALWWFVWGGQRDTVGAITADSAAAVAQATDSPGADSVAPPAASAIGSTAAVNTFVTFANETRDDAAGIDHAGIATGLRDLAAAGEELAMSAPGTPAVTARADSLRSFADQLQRDSTSSRHADVARRAFIVGASMLRELQPADRATTAELDEVQRTAEAIVPATPLLDQRPAVQNYWNAVASAITTDGGTGS